MNNNIACSACYGTGYGVDGKPCPCGCRAATLPAAPAPTEQARLPKLPEALYEEYHTMSAQAHEAMVKDYTRAALAHQMSRIRHLENERDTARKDCSALAARQALPELHKDYCQRCLRVHASVDCAPADLARLAPTEAPKEQDQPFTTAQLEMIEQEVRRRTTECVKIMNRRDPDMNGFFNEIFGDVEQAPDSRNAILDEAIAVVPGGTICDPQQVADAIRALKGPAQ